MEIFHKGCIGCNSQEKYGIGRCLGCQHFDNNNNLPDLNQTHEIKESHQQLVDEHIELLNNRKK